MNRTAKSDPTYEGKHRIRLAGGEAVLELRGDLTSLMREDERPIFRDVLEKIIATLFLQSRPNLGLRERLNQAVQEVLEDQAKTIDVDVDMINAQVLGLEERDKILKSSGPYLSLEELGKVLGVSKQAAHNKVTKGALLGIMIKDQWRLPAWQIKDGEILPGLAAVLNVLSHETALAKLAFFETPNIYLHEQTPRQTLLQGKADRVLKAALNFGEQGAR